MNSKNNKLRQTYSFNNSLGNIFKDRSEASFSNNASFVRENLDPSPLKSDPNSEILESDDFSIKGLRLQLNGNLS
jgi:hypothetical protein